MKKTIKKILLFLVFLFLSTAGGFVFGRILKSVQESGNGFAGLQENFRSLAAAGLPAAYVLISAVLGLVSAAAFLISEKEAKAWDGEEEEVIARVEDRLYIPNILSGAMLILNFLFFPIALYLDHAVRLCGICFVVSFVWIFTINGLLIRLEKKLNPEKRGSILDLDFAKRWEKSCDEAQKWILYQAGYRAYIAANIVCMISWLIAFLGMLAFNAGILALVLVCFIWLSAVLTYVSVGRKLER